jgi:hypothetical protein
MCPRHASQAYVSSRSLSERQRSNSSPYPYRSTSLIAGTVFCGLAAKRGESRRSTKELRMAISGYGYIS